LFDGKCAEAMEFYKTCLGGELTVTKVGESPAKDFMPASMHHKVVYAQLKSDNMNMSASDWLMPNRTPIVGNTVCMFLGGGTKQELKGFFDKLSDGADVTDPLKDVFHGLYGALNDKFGVRWMFQTSSKE
jgi:PhnB protein